MKQLALTQHTVRCPLDDRTASVTVRTDPGGYPSCRHLDVTACSLRPPTSSVLPAGSGYFAHVAAPVQSLCKLVPRHSSKVACPRRCLAILNAAESGAAEPVRCTSGMSDGLELARRTQSPAIMRLLWFYGA